MKPATVVIFIDALGSEIARAHGFLARRPGSHHELQTVIGYSSAAIPSLLTGCLPRDHGHFSMYRRDLGDGLFRSFRPLMLLAHHTRGRGKVRSLLRRHLARRVGGYYELYDVPLDVLAEFDLVQRRDIFAPGGMEGRETFIDRVQRSGIDHRVWTWRSDEGEAFAELIEELRRGEKRFLLLYTARLDALMHRVGTNDPRVTEKLAEYERRVAEVVEAAAGRDLHLYLFSDHGMTDVRQSHDVHALLDRGRARCPDDYLVFTDSTMARFWFRSQAVESEVRALLPTAEWGRWLTGSELASYGIDFPDHRYGEAIFLLQAGHVIAPSYMGKTSCAAMHGYGPEDRTTRAWLFASPVPVPAPASILDLKALMDREVERLAVDRTSP